MPIPLRLYTLPYWPNHHFNFQKSKIKNGGSDKYGAEPFEQQQFGTAGVEGVNLSTLSAFLQTRPDCFDEWLLKHHYLQSKRCLAA